MGRDTLKPFSGKELIDDFSKLKREIESLISSCNVLEKDSKDFKENFLNLKKKNKELKDLMTFAEKGGETFVRFRNEIKKKIDEVKESINHLKEFVMECETNNVSTDLRKELVGLNEEFNVGDKTSQKFLSEMKDKFAELKMHAYKGCNSDEQLMNDIVGKLTEVKTLLNKN